jgi:uncharacterized membrane protein YiaA
MAVAQYVFDALFFVGVAVFAYGFWLAWHPLGFIIGGLALAVFAFLTAQSRQRGNRK